MDQRRHLRRIHLAVGIDLDDDVGAALDRVAHAGEEGAADALVGVVHQRDHARIAAAVGDHDAGALRAAVIDDHDQVDLRTDGRDHRQDRALPRGTLG